MRRTIERMKSQAFSLILVGLAVPALPENGNATEHCDVAPRSTVESALDEAAASEGIERKLLGALAGVESNFDMTARSPRGALGLLQLMPATAAEMGVKDRCDVRENARGGARYLRQMVDEFGNPFLAVAAYNAGPERVRQHKGVPPIPETVRHIAKVMNLYFGLDRDLGRAGKATAKRAVAAQLSSASGVAPTAPVTGFSQNHVLEISDETK